MTREPAPPGPAEPPFGQVFASAVYDVTVGPLITWLIAALQMYFNPDALFSRRPSVGQLVALIAYTAALPFVISELVGGPFPSSDNPFFPLLKLGFSVAVLIEALTLPFWFHVVIRLLGGSGSLYESFRVIAFFDAAMFLPAFLGVLGRVGWFETGDLLWWIAFGLAITTWWHTYRVIAKVHQVSRLRSFVAHTVSFATAMLLWMLLRGSPG